ncbi:tubulin-specific chaperone C-like [Argonauta hians]
MAMSMSDVLTKKDSVTSKLQARDEERHNKIKKRNEERHKKSCDENVDLFLTGIREKKLLIEEFFNTCEDLEKSTLPNKFAEISGHLDELQQDVTEAAIFLPVAVLEKAQSDVNNIKNNLVNKKNALLPKKKFAFKSKKKCLDKTKDEMPKKEETRTDDVEISLTKCNFVGQENEILTKQAEETNKEDVLLTRLTNCTVKLYGAPSAIHIKTLKNCKVFSGPVSSAIFINDCTNCLFVVACQQLRIHQTHKCSFYIHVTSRAIIEECSDVGFAPYNWEYPQLGLHYSIAGLNRTTNNWDFINDFNWLSTDVHSPNWTLIKEEERVLSWPA